MKLFDRNSHLAIRLGDKNLSFSELRSLVDEAKTELNASSAFQSFRFVNSIDVLVRVLAGIEHKIPVALLDANISAEEEKKKLALLKNLNPKTRLILFTSGSSGDPKAVQLSEENIQANTKAVIESLDFKNISEQHLFLPLSYSFGFLGQLLPALELQKTTFLYQDFADFFRSGNLQKASGMISGVPSHWEAMTRALSSPQSQVTQVISAGARLSVDLRHRLKTTFPNATVYNNYGQTEASPRILSLRSTDPGFFEDVVGRPVGDWQIRVNAQGELEAKGSQVMLGYCGEASAPDWLNTGDLAQIDSDGLVHILGRKDDLIKISGERVSLPQIETEMKKILNVSELALIANEDAIRGTILNLVISDSRSDAELRAELAKILEPQRLPKRIIRSNAVPRLPSGKIDRISLRKLLN